MKKVDYVNYRSYSNLQIFFQTNFNTVQISPKYDITVFASAVTKPVNNRSASAIN
jgi:hypothetical protein